MTNHQYVTVSRTLLKRGVTDIERKLAAACTSGAVAYVLLGILAAYKIAVPVQVAELIPLAVGALGGYLTHSVGATTHSVVTEPTGRVTETTTTGAIAVPVAGASFRVPSSAAAPVAVPAPPLAAPSALSSPEEPVPADPVPVEPVATAPVAAESFTNVVEDPAQPHLAGDDGQTQIIPPSAGAQAWAAKYLRTTGGN